MFTVQVRLLYVHRDHKDYLGRGAQDGHLDCHTAPELWTSTETTRLVRDGGKEGKGVWRWGKRVTIYTATSTFTHKVPGEINRSRDLAEGGGAGPSS